MIKQADELFDLAEKAELDSTILRRIQRERFASPEEYEKQKDINVIIADECQFLTPKQIDGLRTIVDEYDIPVLCFGLRTDFLTHLFPGSRRLFEVADSISEIKTICTCGKKAIINARIDENGKIVTEGDQILIGGNDSYVAMCHSCWQAKIKKQKEGK